MVGAIQAAIDGINKAYEKMNKGADSIANIGKAGENGDLVEDIVEIKMAKHSLKANVAVLKAQKEMDKTTIDIII